MTDHAMKRKYSRELKDFHEKGFAIFKGFYDVAAEIEPIRRGISGIIDLMLRQHSIAVPSLARRSTDDEFDAGYLELISKDRKLGGIVYEAVKQVPEFIRLLGGEKNAALACAVRESQAVGVIARGYGIRIDNPAEDKYLTHWHQDYFGQLHSPDGLACWVPLRTVTQELGPVQFCVGSHHDGLAPMYEPVSNGYDKKSETTMYGNNLRIHREDEVIGKYKIEAPLTEVGDLVLIDFASIHRSSPNRAKKPRWSMVLRYFNFESKQGQDYGWRGSYAFGRTWTDVHPELLVQPAPIGARADAGSRDMSVTSNTTPIGHSQLDVASSAGR